MTWVGPALGFIQALALDAANDRVLTAEFRSLFAVDLNSGDRTLISSGDGSEVTDIGTGPAIQIPVSVALDAQNNRLLWLDKSSEDAPASLISVDFSSGNRTLISDSATGSGNRLSRAVPVAVDAAHPRADSAERRRFRDRSETTQHCRRGARQRRPQRDLRPRPGPGWRIRQRR